MNTPTNTRPTFMRYLVVGMTSVMAVLLYLDRFCLSFAEGFIQADLGLTDTQMGWIMGAFFWTYALAQVPTGWLSDRWGARIMLTTYILGWSLFTGLTGLAGSFFVLLFLRLGFGLAQAGAYPTGASIVSRWVPFTQRGMASSAVTSGGRLGGWLALYLTGFVIVWMTPASTPTELQSADLLQPLKIATTLQNDFSLPTAATLSPNQLVVQSLTDEERHAVTRLVAAIPADRVRSAHSPGRSQDASLAIASSDPATVGSHADSPSTGTPQRNAPSTAEPPQAARELPSRWPLASAAVGPSQAESGHTVLAGPTDLWRAAVEEQADARPGKSRAEKRDGLANRIAEDVTKEHQSVAATSVPLVSTTFESTTPIAMLHAMSDGMVAEAESPTASKADESLLLTALNRAIRTPDFFAKANFSGLQLEREASRLAAQDPAVRAADQTQRMNRLILEAVYGKSLRKFYGAGWRPMMMLYGGVGLVVGGLLFFVCRNRPSEHPLCNAAEVDLIGSDARTTVQSERTALPIRAILTNRSLWLCCACQWFTNVGWVLVLTWAPRYFETVHNVPIQERALMVSIPPLVGWAGMLIGGALTDRLVGLLGLQWGRILPMSGSRFLAMGAYLVCMLEPSPWVAVAMLSIVSFATDLGTPPIWAYNQDVGGRHVASILGWGNMWGNLGAAVASSLVIWIAVEQSWTAAFGACALAFFLAGITAAGINATRPLMSEEDAVAK